MRVERPRHHRSSALCAARRFGVIIRKGHWHVEPNAVLLVKKSTAFGPLEESVDARGVKTVAGLVAQIGFRLLGAFLDAPGLASEVPGIQSQPPERAVVPPNRGSFSTIRTLSP